MIKGSINQKDKAILNSYAPKNRAPKTEAATGRPESRKRHFHNYSKKSNTLLSVIERISTHTKKVSMAIEDLDNRIKQFDLVDISRILQSTKAEYTFFQGRVKHSPR